MGTKSRKKTATTAFDPEVYLNTPDGRAALAYFDEMASTLAPREGLHSCMDSAYESFKVYTEGDFENAD